MALNLKKKDKTENRLDIDKKRRSSSRSHKARSAAYTVVVSLVVIILIATLILPSDTTVAQSTIGSIFSPIQRAFSKATIFLRGWFGASSTGSAENDLESMQIEIELLRIQLNEMDELERENERLQDMIDAKNSKYEDLDPVYAKVIAKDTGVWFETFTLNKGLNDGVKVNMAVVNGDGLIGRVSNVGYNYCTVVAIIDPRSSIAALISRTRDNGMLQGINETEDDELECRMYYLANLGNVNVGDKVYTSGLDSRFPKGLYIGNVTAISRSTQSSDKYVAVHPAVDFAAIEEVFILRKQVETIDELPVVPTPTPIPIATPAPTRTTEIYSYETSRIPDDNAIYRYPTATPDPNAPPTPTPEPTPTKPVPEAAWAIRSN